MHRRIVLSGLATVAAATGGVLTGVTPASASSGGNINVVYQVQGGTNALTTLVNTAKTEFQKQYPGWTVTLTPITSPAENDYYTKLDLMNQSASTAPNVMYEDTFLVNSDVAAGYLAPIDSYLAKWSGWKEFSPAAQAAAKGANGHIYGVSMGTDTRGLYYNKQIFAKVGLPVPWHPTSWTQVLAAAETIKAKDPGVTPINVYGGVGEGEGSTMQGFEMFLYGTNNWLWDSKTAKWEKAGAGFQAALTQYQTIYVKDNLGPTVQTALSTQGWQTVQQGLMPTGKLGIDLDGSWVSSTYLSSGPKPWPQYSKVLGVAPMPTENGQGPATLASLVAGCCPLGHMAPARRSKWRSTSSPPPWTRRTRCGTTSTAVRSRPALTSPQLLRTRTRARWWRRSRHSSPSLTSVRPLPTTRSSLMRSR